MAWLTLLSSVGLQLLIILPVDCFQVYFLFNYSTRPAYSFKVYFELMSKQRHVVLSCSFLVDLLYSAFYFCILHIIMKY